MAGPFRRQVQRARRWSKGLSRLVREDPPLTKEKFKAITERIAEGCGPPQTGVAVGTRVTSRPPHRSVHETFPHTAPYLGSERIIKYTMIRMRPSRVTC
jgi:hypothetical protein